MNRKIGKHKIEINRVTLSRISEFKDEIKDKLVKIQTSDDKMNALQKDVKTFENNLKEHLDKYPTDEYAMDLIKGKSDFVILNIGKEIRNSSSFTPLDFIMNTTLEKVTEKVMKKVRDKYK